MSKARAAIALTLLALPSVASSQRYTYIPVYIPSQSEVWSVKRGVPYAVWNARSSIAVGSEVSITKANNVVDTAPLTPQAVYATDQDLTEDGKIWLPKGGLLVKMTGGEGDWYCTWRFDTQAFSSDPKPLMKKDAETELCVRWDGGKTYSPRLAQAMYASLMTVTFFGTRVGQNEIEQTNAVGLSEVDPASLPPRANLAVAADAKRGLPCLTLRVLELRGSNKCFAAVGDTISFAGGAYTLLHFTSKTDYGIRVDAPMNARGVAPEVVK